MDRDKYIQIARNLAATNPNCDQKAFADKLFALFEEAYDEGYSNGYGECRADVEENM